GKKRPFANSMTHYLQGTTVKDLRLILYMVVPLLLLAACTPRAMTEADCTADQRLFDHEALATGAVCVPKNPQRVAFIDEIIGVAPVLDVNSVSRSTYGNLFYTDFPYAFDESDFETMVDIGHPRSPNSEVLLQVEPDVIMSGSNWRRANRLMDDIAPMVIWDWEYTTDWTVYLRAMGEVLNRSEEAEQAIAEMEQRMAMLQEHIGETDETYVVVRTTDENDSIQVFTTFNFGAEHVANLGLTMPDDILTPEEAADENNAWWYSLSIEKLQYLDADHIFLLSGWEPDIQAEFLANPLWQTLGAVQNGRVHFIEGEYWVRTHPVSSHRIIDDIFVYVASVDPTEVAPNPYAWTYQEGMERP
ncbi:MAG: ABC transporter substrate-binding protein, partial [Chloroflexota bacterium]